MSQSPAYQLPNFTQCFSEKALPDGPLKGLYVGVKDLFDVQGYVTHAGSIARNSTAPASKDSDAVARLRAAGASLIGHTNMTEFAYSGLGLNPHFGTPLTPLISGAIAGGSTSGGAAALAGGKIDIALGTDTGGSARIPAAFCGVTGFKSTAAKISQVGAVPLSHTLDSVGILAKSVPNIIKVFDVLKKHPDTQETPLRKLIIPKTFGMSDLDPKIEHAFWNAVSIIEHSGYQVQRTDPEFLHAYSKLPIWHFSAVESRLHHATAYETAREKIDPRVAARMARADEVSALDYARTLSLRNQIANAALRELQGTLILLPTVAILPPQLSVFEDPTMFDTLNLLALRNTSLGNIIDGCSLSLPMPNLPGAGIMLTGCKGADSLVLDLGLELENRLY